MKKSLVALLLVFSVLFTSMALVACRRPQGQNADLSGGYDGSAVTITFYHTMSAENLQPVLDDAIARFNVLYPNITVEHKQVGDYDAVRNQIKNEITVGDQPNLAYCYPDHVALYNVAKAVLPLDELIASTVEVERADGTKEVMGLTQAQIDDFIPGFYNEGKAYGDGKMYTLPYSKSTEVLYYNKTALRAGLSSIRRPETRSTTSRFPPLGTRWTRPSRRSRLLSPTPPLSDMTPRLTGSSPCASSTAPHTPAQQLLTISSTTRQTGTSLTDSQSGMPTVL